MFAKLFKILPHRWQRFLLLTFVFIWFGAIMGAINASGAFVFASYLSAIISIIASMIFLFNPGDGS